MAIVASNRAITSPRRRSKSRVLRRLTLSLIALVIAVAGAVAGVGWHEGYRIYVVHTGSMVPTLNPGDAVLDRPAPAAVRPGEIVTFAVHSGPDSVVTHRVASVSDGKIKTKGDANRTVDPWTVPASDVIGSKLLALPYGGYLLVYLQHPQGIVSVLTAVVALILLWQLFFPPDPGVSGEDAAGEQPNSRRPRHKRDSPPDDTDEMPPVLILPAPRWLDVYRTPPSFLRGNLGSSGLSSDRRSYFV